MVCLAEGLVYAIPNTQRIDIPDHDRETCLIHRNPSETPRGLEEREICRRPGGQYTMMLQIWDDERH